MSRPTMIMRPNMHDITTSGHQARVIASIQKLEDRRSHHKLTCSSMLLLVSGNAIN